MPLEVLLRSTRVSTLQAYHGAVASPVTHALTARQLLVVARERCRSCARDGGEALRRRVGGLAGGWRVGRETAPMTVSAVESGIDGRTWISSPGIIRPHEAIRRVKAGRSRLAIVMGAVSRPTRPHSCLKNAPPHVFTRRCAAKTRFWHAGPVRKPPNRGRMPHSQGSMKRDLGFCCKVSTSKMPKSTEGCQKLVFAAHGTTETCRAGRRAARYRNGAERAIGVSRPGSRDRCRRASASMENRTNVSRETLAHFG